MAYCFPSRKDQLWKFSLTVLLLNLCVPRKRQGWFGCMSPPPLVFQYCVNGSSCSRPWEGNLKIVLISHKPWACDQLRTPFSSLVLCKNLMLLKTCVTFFSQARRSSLSDWGCPWPFMSQMVLRYSPGDPNPFCRLDSEHTARLASCS